MREAAQLPVARFARLAGIPERTYRRRLATLRAGDEPVKGPWPTPAVDGIEALAAKYASDWPAWGHRKIAAMMRADGHQVSTSTVERALRRRGLLLQRGFRADRKSWTALRRKVFHDPPTERNRVWQTDFSEFETPSGGIWRICAVIDYATKYCLAAKITPTGTSICIARRSTTAAPSRWKPPVSATSTTASGLIKRSVIKCRERSTSSPGDHRASLSRVVRCTRRCRSHGSVARLG